MKYNLKEIDWCIKSDNTYIFNDTVIKYLNVNSESAYGGYPGLYYGMLNKKVYYSSQPFGISITLDDFIESTTDKWVPKVGELVEVMGYCDNYYKRIYLCTIPRAKNPYICVDDNHTDSFLNSNESVSVTAWNKIRKITEINITCTVDGKVKNPKEFTEEEWLELRLSK